MKILNRKEKTGIFAISVMCILIIAFVIWMFTKLDDMGNKEGTSTPTAFTTQPSQSGTASTPGNIGETPSPSPTESQLVIIPQTDGPVFIGTASSISVDCIDPQVIKLEVNDKLHYMGFSQSDYTIEQKEDHISIKIGIKSDKEKFEELYVNLLKSVYSSDVEQHLENGVSVDKEKEEIEGEYSYLTIRLYEKYVE